MKYTIGIVGLGLIGGSFAKAYSGEDVKLLAWNRNKETLQAAMADCVDEELTKDNINQCDLVILTTFPEHCIEWLTEFGPYLNKNTICIDAAGTKRKICSECWKLAKNYGFTFVGAHPMAGTQYSGYANSSAKMYRGAPMVLVPSPELSDMDKVVICDRIQDILKPCHFGSYTLSTPEWHDKIIAYTSQLAHVVSSAYANNEIALCRQGFSAGSWKDLTRVAWMNPSMWAELFLENSDYLSEMIGHVIDNLIRCKDAIDDSDYDSLVKFLSEGDAIKRKSEDLEMERA